MTNYEQNKGSFIISDIPFDVANRTVEHHPSHHVTMFLWFSYGFSYGLPFGNLPWLMNMAIEIESVPIKHGDVPSGNVFDRVYLPVSYGFPMILSFSSGFSYRFPISQGFSYDSQFPIGFPMIFPNFL